jgi:hypothetical protein
MMLKSVFRSSLIIAAFIQAGIVCYIFFDTYLVNENVQDNKFRYSLYVSFLALQIFPFCLIIVMLIKYLFAYLKKK